MSVAASAVVFANGTVGVRCLAALLAGGVSVPLVVTHRADPTESAFTSVEAYAGEQGLPVEMPDDPNDDRFTHRIESLAADFVFSFYYRRLLAPRLLAAGRLGAFNMHGSLLPKYRGRAPINWAVIRGETETGATLHYMIEKPDAGDIVDQQAVPILPDDTAFEVRSKVTVAAEIVLCRSLPALVRGRAVRRPQQESAATSFGRRRPEDGRIDWDADAKTIHDLVRGVAPPYPGAFTTLRGREVRILKVRRETRPRRAPHASLYFEDGVVFVDCGGGGVLRVVEAELDRQRVSPVALQANLAIEDAFPLTQMEEETP